MNKLILTLTVLMVALSIPQCDARDFIASYYSIESLKKEGTWKRSKGRCADGSLFHDRDLTCATLQYNLGTMLAVTDRQTKRTVTVKVTDRISRRFGNTRVDLSKGAMIELVGSKVVNKKIVPKKGLIPVSVEVAK